MNVNEAARAILRGEVVAYATESSWGLGVDALSEGALETLFSLKGREVGKPPLALVDGDAMLDMLVEELPARARAWAKAFWPGPLTMVLPAKRGLPEAMVSHGGVGVRHSPHAVATAIVRAVGRPITSTSANLAGKPPAMKREEVQQVFGDRVGIVDEGEAGGAAASTVVKIDLDGTWRVLREGPITKKQLEDV